MNEQEKEMIDEEFKEAQEKPEETEVKHEFHPNVFENYDAQTGKKIENFEVVTESLDSAPLQQKPASLVEAPAN